MTESIKIRNYADTLYFSTIDHDTYCEFRLPGHGLMWVRSGRMEIHSAHGVITAQAGQFIFWQRDCSATMKKFHDGDTPFRSIAIALPRELLKEQRNNDFASGEYRLAGGVVDPLPDDAPQFVKDYYAYYKTPRGYAKNSLNSNNGWNMTSALSWINTPILAYAGEIETPVLVLHGENAHSRYFGEDAFKLLKGDNKQLVIVPGANHTDLYDGGPEHNMIPWDTVYSFFKDNLK